MNKITILIVEDNLFDYESLLRKLGYLNIEFNLIHVKDGEEAIHFLFKEGAYSDEPDHKKPDMILLDVMMPRMNGTDVLRKIREEGSDETKSIPIIIFTKINDNDAINKECFELGANGFLTKPVSSTQLKDFFIRFKLI
jgi:two-component system, response regulator